jgi:hypothetical protein
MGSAFIKRRDGSEKTYPIDPFNQTVRVVCENCNHGWMNGLETKVRSFLGPMIRHGKSTKLGPTEQASLAAWAIKTGLMLEYLHPIEKVVPDSVYHAIFATKQPPAGHLVWMAHRTVFEIDSGRELIVSSLEESLPRFDIEEAVYEKFINVVNKDPNFKKTHNVFRLTYTIGHVVFQVFGHNLPFGFKVVGPPNKVIQPIWPIISDVTWPPADAVEIIGGLVGLHNAFDAPLNPEQKTKPS